MPVPTENETLRRIRTLNLTSSALAAILLAIISWLIVDGWCRPGRAYQQDGRLWRAVVAGEEARQVNVPGVRTDPNILTVETADACQTCHINIDRPEFVEGDLVKFVQRQVARSQNQDIDTIDDAVVAVDFWENAIEKLIATGADASVRTRLLRVQQETLNRINLMRDEAGDLAIKPLKLVADLGDKDVTKWTAAQVAQWRELLAKELERIAQTQGNGKVPRRSWREQRMLYVDDLATLIRQQVGEKEFALLQGHFRHTMIDQFNALRKASGAAAVSSNPVMLAHPRLDLYLDTESPHPFKSMGCSVCHEGSGQRTSFLQTAHTPRRIWVDAETGATVAEFLLTTAASDRRSESELRIKVRDYKWEPVVSSKTEEMLESRANLADSAKPQAAGEEGRAAARIYIDPATNQARVAVRQATYWEKKYHWQAVDPLDWERPMHAMEYVQSSCTKCHTGHHDLKEEAPKVFQGRKLFAQVGCANCHQVDQIADHKDLKKVGPSLAHVKEKLSSSMLATWIWSPRAFRPTSRMPHFFMLENNSFPVDILRTRTEVAALTHYLLNAPPASVEKGAIEHSGIGRYQPELRPTRAAGDVKRGRELFMGVPGATIADGGIGCAACHSNLNETGQQWITADLMKRQGLSSEKALWHYNQLSYNQKHAYVLQHTAEKLNPRGPELSGVGTKLKAGRDAEGAAEWVYDWLRNPKHYSSYTIMPSFRLSEQEALDLSAYLLAQERPGDSEGTAYAPVDFIAEIKGELNAQMLDVLTTKLGGDEKQTVEAKLMFVGKKLVMHYNCQACHQVNGFEEAASSAPHLNDWGLKDPRKLDFGFFDHAKDRREWATFKLHNPRIYDRGRFVVSDAVAALDPQALSKVSLSLKQAMARGVDRAYDKLKMPKFFLTDEDAQSIITFISSIRKPLVDPVLQKVADDAGKRATIGRQIAEKYNCYGCHNIEANKVAIHSLYDVLDDRGQFNGNFERLGNAPPRLIGQGAKTQPGWLTHYLGDVHPLRPWLKVRMPSFHLSNDEATAIADFFAGATAQDAARIANILAPIDSQLEQNDARQNELDLEAAKIAQRKASLDHWSQRPELARASEELRAVALRHDLAQPRLFDPRQTTPEDRAATMEAVLAGVRFLHQTYRVQRPSPPLRLPEISEERFARGEALYNQILCAKCHALGDEAKLLAIWKLDNPNAAAPEELPAASVGPAWSAPNLRHVAHRIEPQWADHWLQRSMLLLPGTKMPSQWAGPSPLDSFFFQFPDEAKAQAHGKYFHTGPEQRQLILDYIYAAGLRNYTPGTWKLEGKPEPKVELPQVRPP